MNGEIQIGGPAHCQDFGEDYDGSEIHDCPNDLKPCPFCGGENVFCLSQRPDDSERKLLDLLAIIHGDGGHYRAKHGLQKAYDDALAVVAALKAEAR